MKRSMFVLIGSLVLFSFLKLTYAQSLARVTGNSTRYIDADGKVWVCGENTEGALGNGTEVDSYVFIDISNSGALSGKRIVSLAAGDMFGLALDDQGVVYTWGQAYYGKLGDGRGDDANRLLPGPIDTSGVLSGKKVIYIAAATQFCFGITDDGKLYSWGRNYFGTLGDGTGGNNDDHNSNVPVAVDTNGALSGKRIVAVSAFLYHALALDSKGIVYAWGLNENGQLGNNSTVDSHVPVVVDTSGVLKDKKIIDIATGSAHSLALDSDGHVYAWGSNEYGQLGNNSSVDSYVPVMVDTNGVLKGKKIVAIAAGFSHSLALDSDGKIYAWGLNDHGQLGNNSTVDSPVPVMVDTNGVLAGKNIVRISAGNVHSVAMDDNGIVYTWGCNDHGQLGDGTTEDRHVPIIPGAGPPPEPEVLTGFEENFDTDVDTAFWANVIGADQNNITGMAEDGAFKYVCNPNRNYWFSVWWKFDAEPHTNRYFDLSKYPYLSFRAKVEPGATWNGNSIDNVDIGFDINGADEYLGQQIPDDGQWHNVLFTFDSTNTAYAHCTEFRLHPGVSDKDAVFDPGFVGTIWIDDLRIGDKVKLKPELVVKTGFSEDFSNPVNLDFWIPNKKTHSDGTPIFFVMQQQGALKVAMRQENYDDGQMYDFSKLGILLNLSENPRARISLKVENGAKLSGNSVDSVNFSLSPFSSDTCTRGNIHYPYAQQHSPVTFAVPTDNEWHTYTFDWSTPDTQPAADGYVYPNDYSQISYLLLETVGAPDSLYEATFWIDDFLVGDQTTGVESREHKIVTDFELLQNYPNPFNPRTTIRYALPKATHVTLTLFNINGEKVATLVDENEQAGYHKVSFDGSHLSSGLYFYRLKTSEFTAVKQMVLVK